MQACLLAASLTGASACFSPEIQEGLACSETQSCPGGQSCTIGVCRSARFGPDAGRQDGPPDANEGCIGSKTFSFINTIERFSIPACATIVTIEAFGAQGGGTASDSDAGGKGARMRADFLPSPGAVFRILVGAKGVAGSPVDEFSQGGGTGGGGSFVVNESNAPMLIAGGGGGATEGTAVVQRGGPGQVTQDAQNGGGGGAGLAGIVLTTNDLDGGDSYITEYNGYHGGTGGGGFFTNGFYDSVGTVTFGTKNNPGQSFLNGADGGRGGSQGRDGGYGGGGAAGFTGGGGGGFTGGGAGGPGVNSTLHGGGGGGSMSSGTNPDSSPGVNSGDGKVIFSWRK